MINKPVEPDILAYGGEEEDLLLFGKIRRLLGILIREKAAKHKRFLSIPDYVVDRWERAKMMGFGEGASVYDSCLVLGDVKVGKNTWIGPYTILDGSGGGLKIGEECSISAGVHIYTHDTVDRVIKGAPVSIAAVTIGDHVYIGPQTVVAKGVTIGDYVVVGANSLVNRDIPSGAKAFGTPARIVGKSDDDRSH
jgi:acetyltransferase-like isoleucine patch superfamily enzyme